MSKGNNWAVCLCVLFFALILVVAGFWLGVIPEFWESDDSSNDNGMSLSSFLFVPCVWIDMFVFLFVSSALPLPFPFSITYYVFHCVYFPLQIKKRRKKKEKIIHILLASFPHFRLTL